MVTFAKSDEVPGAQTKNSRSSFSMKLLLLTSPATEDEPGSTGCGHRSWRHAAATNHVSRRLETDAKTANYALEHILGGLQHTSGLCCHPYSFSYAKIKPGVSSFRFSLLTYLKKCQCMFQNVKTLPLGAA